MRLTKTMVEHWLDREIVEWETCHHDDSLYKIERVLEEYTMRFNLMNYVSKYVTMDAHRDKEKDGKKIER